MPLASKPGAPHGKVKVFLGEKPKKINGVCQHVSTDVAYGLAGGGIGPYEFCMDCGVILAKTQDEAQ